MNPKYVTLSVSLQTGCYRHLQMPLSITLERLAGAILEAFDFDNDHAHVFFMDNKTWSMSDCHYSREIDDNYVSTDRIKLQSLELEKGRKFKFLFDFGDEWLFQCSVLELSDEGEKMPTIVKSRGEAPPQYSEYDACDNGDVDNCDFNEYEEHPQVALFAPDTALLDAAFRYKATKLWKKLYDTDVFAVQLPHGEIGYCSVMGKNGEFNALSVYLGRSGWNSFLKISQEAETASRADLVEFAAIQDNITCEFTNKSDLRFTDADVIAQYARERGIRLRGANAYTDFSRSAPECLPHAMTDAAHGEALTEALLAAVEISRLLESGETWQSLGMGGIFETGEIPFFKRTSKGYSSKQIKVPTVYSPEFPSPDFAGAAKMKKLTKDGKWECELFYLPEPYFSDKDGVRRYYAALLGVEAKSHMVRLSMNQEGYMQYPAITLNDFASQLIEDGICPKSIAVRDVRTELLLRDFCDKCGIILIKSKKLPTLDKAKADFLDSLNSEDTENEMLGYLVNASEKELSEIPTDLIRDILESCPLTDELENKLRRVLKSRD